MTKSPQVKVQTTSAEGGLKKRKRSAGSDPEGATGTRPPPPIPTAADSDILSLTEAPPTTSGFVAVSTLLSTLKLSGITLSPSVTLEDGSYQAGPQQVGL